MAKPSPELWFEGQKYYALYLDNEHEEKTCLYFNRPRSGWTFTFRVGTPVLLRLCALLARTFKMRFGLFWLPSPTERPAPMETSPKSWPKAGLPRMSAQAVGGAVGKNEISIIVPCHRVVGSNGSLTGYAGGIAKKVELLKLEHAFKGEYFIPKHSTAP